MKIILFGATGRIGRKVIQKLQKTSHIPILAVGRKEEVLKHLKVEYRVHDIIDSQDWAFLDKNDIIINVAHIKHSKTIIQNLPEGTCQQYICLGSTRYKTKFQDKIAQIVNDSQNYIQQHTFNWTILHPTMIYHTSDENNIQRLVKFMRLSPVIPLPNYGNSLLQPIHGDDVVKSVINSIQNPLCFRKKICIAGQSAISYRHFVKLIAQHYRLRSVPISLPFWSLHIFLMLNHLIPFTPKISYKEIERLLEDKDIDISDMKNYLGFQPISFEDGVKDLT